MDDDTDYLEGMVLDYEVDPRSISELVDIAVALPYSPAPTSFKPNQTTSTTKISIRVPHDVLAALKDQAVLHGERYQTFINQILAGHAAGYLVN